jgi:hypothetical protein
MLAYHNSGFAYPGLGGSIGWCEVAVYWDLQGASLVLIQDHDQHGSTSVTNVIETVCGLVQTRVLNALGILHKDSTLPAGKGNTLWVAWSAGGVAYAIAA